MVARYRRVFCPDCPLVIEGYGDEPVRQLAQHGREQHPDPFLLEAMREVDALTPAVPPMAPVPTADDLVLRLRRLFRDEAVADGKGGWLLLVDRDLYLQALAPRSTVSDMTIKAFVETNFGLEIRPRPAPPALPAPDLDLFERVRK